MSLEPVGNVDTRVVVDGKTVVDQQLSDGKEFRLNTTLLEAGKVVDLSKQNESEFYDGSFGTEWVIPDDFVACDVTVSMEITGTPDNGFEYAGSGHGRRDRWYRGKENLDKWSNTTDGMVHEIDDNYTNEGSTSYHHGSYSYTYPDVSPGETLFVLSNTSSDADHAWRSTATFHIPAVTDADADIDTKVRRINNI